MDPADRSVDHHIFEIGGVREGQQDAFPYALFCPTPEARVDGEPVAELAGQIAPGRARAGDPQDRLDKQPIILSIAPWITRLSRRLMFNATPPLVRQAFANQGWPPSSSSLEPNFDSVGNPLNVNRT